MGIKTIPLSRLEADPRRTLTECADSSQALVVELPGDRFVAIRPVEPGDDDSLVSEVLEPNATFQALVARSKPSPRKPFTGGSGSWACCGASTGRTKHSTAASRSASGACDAPSGTLPTRGRR